LGLLAASLFRILCSHSVLSSSRVNWFARHKTLSVAFLLALLAGAVMVYLSLSPDELTRYKARLSASGEELSVVKLSPPYSREAANYHQQLGDATARLVVLPIHPSDIAPMNRATPGFARAAWAQPAPSGAGAWEDLEVQMNDSEPALRDLRRLLAAPVSGNSQAQFPRYAKSPFDFVARRKMAQTLAAAVVNDLHQGRLDAGLTNVSALIALARFNDKTGVLVDHMIHVAIAGLAIAATWESLQAPGWTETQLAALQSEWQRLELARGFMHTAEMERAFAVAYYDLVRTNASERRQIFGSAARGGGFSEMLYEGVYLPFWASSWSRRDELNFLETMQPVIESLRRATNTGDYHAMRATFATALHDVSSRRTILGKLRYPMASMVVPNWEKATTTLLRYETQRQMALTALALKRHQLKHGKLPASLAVLVPEFLAAAPIDYMNGGRLTYVRLSDERFTLRSVGNDEHDDEGAGDDLVWPELEKDSIVGSSLRP
jgi:hypothetical protein